MSVFELAGLQALRRLSLVRVHKLTDIGIFALAEHALGLERLHMDYCDKLSLDAVHLLLKSLEQLQHLTVTGIPAFKRKGIRRFSDAPPSVSSPCFRNGLHINLTTAIQTLDIDQQAAFFVFDGPNVKELTRFLNKEELRRRQAEARNIPFTPRSDDKLVLY